MAIYQKSQFLIPKNIIYHDGNSLGPLTKPAKKALNHAINQQWGNDLITSWNKGWLNLSSEITHKLAHLLGAKPSQIAVGDSTSVQWYKLLRALLPLSNRHKILIEQDIFPTNSYILGQITQDFPQYQAVPSQNILADIDDKTNLVAISMVDYRSAKLLDLEPILAKCKKHHAKIILDFSHAMGLMPLYCQDWQIDGAVACGYKYCNGGPGAPATIYISDKYSDSVNNPIAGWLGASSPFEFSAKYQPAEGVKRMISGTPPVLGLTALNGALSLFDSCDMAKMQKKSWQLSEIFLSELAEFFQNGELQLYSPQNKENRGGHLALGHRHAYAVMQNLIHEGIIGDFRPPNMMRLAFTPLYLSNADIVNSAHILWQILTKKSYLNPEFQIKKPVV